MPDDEDFTTLSKQFQTLTKKLKESNDPKARKGLLAEIRKTIAALDRLAASEFRKLPSK